MKTSEKGIKTISDVYFATPSNIAKKIFFYITSTGHFYYEDDYQLYRTNFNSYLIMFIRNGSARIYYDDKTYIAKKNDMVFLNCYKKHGYDSCGNLETLWVHFDGCNSLEYLNTLYETNGCVISLKDTYTAYKHINKLYKEHSIGINVNEAIQSADIARVLAEFFEYSTQKLDTGTSAVEETIKYINNHITEELHIKEMADHVALSVFYFSRLFKKETGYTPHEYVVKTRITKAKILLKSTNSSSKEIAFQCGFTNESSFANTFKKNTDMTPGTFRKMLM